MRALTVTVVAAASAVVLTLAGCATQKPPPAAPQRTVLDEINERVAEAAAAQQELASVVSANTNAPKREPKDVFADEVTIDYVGDIEVILARIAKQYGYEFEVLGKRPPEGVMVNLFMKKPRPVVDVLRALGYQFPTTVDVNLDKTSIQLVYKG